MSDDDYKTATTDEILAAAGTGEHALMPGTFKGHPVTFVVTLEKGEKEGTVDIHPVALLLDPEFCLEFAEDLCDPTGKPLRSKIPPGNLN